MYNVLFLTLFVWTVTLQVLYGHILIFRFFILHVASMLVVHFFYFFMVSDPLFLNCSQKWCSMEILLINIDIGLRLDPRFGSSHKYSKRLSPWKLASQRWRATERKNYFFCFWCPFVYNPFLAFLLSEI